MTFTGKIVACTGHRLKSLGGYDPAIFEKLVSLSIHCLKRLEPKLVITGGALGWDQACASACGILRIPYDVYYPFEGYDARWPEKSRERARDIHSLARVHRVVCADGYEEWKMEVRNEEMVDDAEIVLALYNGIPKGGTHNCVTYARRMGRQVLNCWDRYKSGDF